MRALAEVGEITLGVGGDRAVLEILLNVLNLVGLAVGGELLHSISLAHLASYHGLVLASQLHHLLLYLGKVILRNHVALLGHHVIEETIFHSRTEAELYAGVELLQGLCQQVSAGVPEGVLALLVLKTEQLYRSVLSDGTVQFCGYIVHSAAHHIASQCRRNTLGYLQAGNTALILSYRAVGERNLYHLHLIYNNWLRNY